MAALNIINTQVDSHGVGWKYLRRRRLQVQEVAAMQYRPGETYNHIPPLPPIPCEVPVQMLCALSRRIYHRIRILLPIQQL